MSTFIKLCGVDLPVVAQKHARLKRRLSVDDFQAILTGNYGRESYRVLSILVPALPAAIPEWKWEGFTSQEAMEQDNYVEDEDQSPSFDDIARAFELALKVNGGDRVGKLLGLFQTVERLTTTATSAASTQSSPVSPGESGALD